MRLKTTNPRKGTETAKSANIIVSGLKTTNPRKGTETVCNSLVNLAEILLKTTNPRKGTETLPLTAVARLVKFN